MSLRDTIKGALFEQDEQKPKQQPTPGKAPIVMPRLSSGNITYAPAPPPSTGIYQRLKERTDFAESVPGKILMKYLAPLESLPIEEHAKYKAAMAQAIAQERSFGIDRVLGAFDSLKAALQSEQTEFQSGLTALENNLNENKKNLEALDVSAQQLRQTISEQSAKIESAKADFQAALAARTAELDQQKSKYTELLK